MGTPAYMSPEQASGDLKRIGPSSDVYNLGATLYVILTGTVPVDDPDVGEVMRRVQAGEIVPPRKLNPKIAPALEAICRKAMAVNPQDRYPTSRVLAEDLEHWLADEPVSAWREPVVRRIARWGRRHRLVASAIAACLFTASISLIVGLRAVQEERARKRQVMSDYTLAAQALVEIVDLMSLSRSDFAPIEPSSVVPPQDFIRSLKGRLGNTLARLKAGGQDAVADRIENVLRHYNERIRGTFETSLGPGFGGGLETGSNVFPMIGD